MSAIWRRLWASTDSQYSGPPVVPRTRSYAPHICPTLSGVSALLVASLHQTSRELRALPYVSCFVSGPLLGCSVHCYGYSCERSAMEASAAASAWHGGHPNLTARSFRRRRSRKGSWHALPKRAVAVCVAPRSTYR